MLRGIARYTQEISVAVTLLIFAAAIILAVSVICSAVRRKHVSPLRIAALTILILIAVGITAAVILADSSPPPTWSAHGSTVKWEEMVPLEDLPDDYTVEQAKEDGCVVHENGSATYGATVWDSFWKAVSSGEEAAVRIAFYYNEPFEFYIHDLTYDGKNYMLRWFEDGTELERNYRFLMRYEGEVESPTARYDHYIRYVLTNDDTVSWEDLFFGAVSSQFGDYIDHFVVYTELLKEATGVVGPGRPIAAWIEDDVTEAHITYRAGGSETQWVTAGEEIDRLREWTADLKYEIYQSEDGSSPGDVEGGEVYEIVLKQGSYPGYIYVVNGEDDCYLLIEGYWYQVLNPSDPPVNIE